MVVASSIPVVGLLPTSSRNALAIALGRVQGTDGKADITNALQIASDAQSSNDRRTLIVVSDGAFESVSSRVLGRSSFRNCALSFVKVGSSRINNMRIENFSMRSSASGVGSELFINVSEYSGMGKAGSLIIRDNSKVLYGCPVQLDHNGLMRRVVSTSAIRNGDVLEASLDGVKDALTDDNTAYLVASAEMPVTVAYVGKSSPILDAALSADPNVRVLHYPSVTSIPSVARANIDIFVIDETQSNVKIPDGNSLVFGLQNSDTPVFKLKATPNHWAQSIAVRGPDSISEDVHDVQWKCPYTTKLNTGAVSLVSTPDGPMVAEGWLGHRHIVNVACGITDTNWAQKPSFPIFIHDAILRLERTMSVGRERNCWTAGHRIEVGSEAHKAYYVSPVEGRGEAVAIPQENGTSEGAEYVPEVAGIYTVRTNGRAIGVFAVQCDTTDDTIAARFHSELVRSALATPAATRSWSFRSITLMCSLLVIATVALEWLIYQRAQNSGRSSSSRKEKKQVYER